MMRKWVCIVMVCFIVITTFTGCSALQKLGLQKNYDDEAYPVSSIAIGEEEAKKLNDKVQVHLYFANEDRTKLKLEVRYIDATDAKKSVNTLASTIVKELIKGPSPQSGLKPVIPEGTELRGPVSISAGVATVDLTKAFIDKHPGGKVEEELTIYSIVNSLTELKEIQKVKFTIEGKPRKDFKGNFQFDATFQKNPIVIAKAESLPVAAPKGGSKDSKTTKPADTKNNTTKPADTKGPSSSTSTGQSSSTSDEDAEATYLEILE